MTRLTTLLLVLVLAPTDAADPVPRTDLFGDPLPPGAVARLGTTRYRVSGWHQQVFLSPDANTVIGKGEEGVLVFWDAATGKTLAKIKDAGLFNWTADQSPDGTRLAVFGLARTDKPPYHPTLRLYDLTTRKAALDQYAGRHRARRAAGGALHARRQAPHHGRAGRPRLGRRERGRDSPPEAPGRVRRDGRLAGRQDDRRRLLRSAPVGLGVRVGPAEGRHRDALPRRDPAVRPGREDPVRPRGRGGGPGRGRGDRQGHRPAAHRPRRPVGRVQPGREHLRDRLPQHGATSGRGPSPCTRPPPARRRAGCRAGPSRRRPASGRGTASGSPPSPTTASGCGTWRPARCSAPTCRPTRP